MLSQLTIATAVVGGAVCVKFKVPAGAMIGSMLSVAVLNIITGSHVEFPVQMRFFTQIATGAFIGSKIRKNDIYALRAIIAPVLVLTACMLSFSAVSGLLLSQYTRLDLVTALFAAAPAGIADMTLASMSFHADSAKVALLQMIRLMAVLAFTPAVAKYISQKHEHLAPSAAPIGAAPAYRGNMADVAKTLAVGLVFGTAGLLSRFPAGAISFAMVGCAGYNIMREHAYMPLRLRQLIQFFAGAYIGGMITRSQALELLTMYDVVIAVIISFYVMNFFVAFMLVKVCKMDVLTALLSSSAGGLTDMALVADELGTDRAKVAAMQLIRVVGIITLYPPLISVLAGLAN